MGIGVRGVKSIFILIMNGNYTCIIIFGQMFNDFFSDLSEMTGIKKEDVISTLQHLDLVRYYKGQYVIVLNEKLLLAHK